MTIVPGCAAGNVALITHAVVHSGTISQLRQTHRRRRLGAASGSITRQPF
jgi:hypothetical protein